MAISWQGTQHQELFRLIDALKDPRSGQEIFTLLSSYAEAINDMLHNTSTETAPWNLMPANHKWSMRVAVTQRLNEQLIRGVDIKPPPLDPSLLKAAKKHLGQALSP